MKLNNYIVVSTLCNSKKTADKIVKGLLKKKLVVGCQVYGCDSTYFWRRDIESQHEYLIQSRSRESLYPKIEEEIKRLHDYEVCEISYYVINGGSKEFFDWIDDEI